MALNSVQSYLHERNVRLRYEWRHFQQLDQNSQQTTDLFTKTSLECSMVLETSNPSAKECPNSNLSTTELNSPTN